MGMNGISAKLKQSQSDRNHREEFTGSPEGLELIPPYSPPDEPKPIQKYERIKVDLETMKAKYEGEPNLGRRIAPRFKIAMAVTIFTTFHSFKTECVDISETGARLKDLLPTELMTEPIEVLFSYRYSDGSTSNMLFYGQAVGGPLRTPRISFTAAAKHAAVVLQSLVVKLNPTSV